ncbi:phage terminase small subunit [Yersinia aleksiciae]|uniref:Terminase n=2 Tax=Yersinia aleksiciae TaxID=263819 RepID=A0ABM5UH95_YERAE|nr:phage terminase small subunit [Yersinia aleksiciae]AKP35133.1 terminase [Yersinia aleksiciae]CFQ42784.1 phage terminase/endonuclease subunit [Yersinia aleksiciae]
MLTPAQRHYDKVMAERRGTKDDVVQGSAYEQQLYRLRIDQRRLSQFQSHITRASMKREMLPAYDGWIDGVLTANTGQSDEVVTTCMVWSVDAGLYRDALRLAEYVISHNLPMADKYQRTAACFIVDQVSEAALLRYKGAATDNPAIEIDLLLRLQELTADKDMPDEARAKLLKAIGYTQRESTHLADQASALIWLQRALAAHKDAGVKKDIEVLERNLKKAALIAASAASAGVGDTEQTTATDVITTASADVTATAPDIPVVAAEAPAKPARKTQSAAAAKKSAAKAKTNTVRAKRTP